MYIIIKNNELEFLKTKIDTQLLKTCLKYIDVTNFGIIQMSSKVQC